MVERTLTEWVTDHLLLVYVCSIATKIKDFHRTRLQKIVFLSQKELWENQLEGFDFNFVKHHLGPFSFEIRGSHERLASLKMLHESSSHGFLFTAHGHQVLKGCKEVLDRNSEILRVIDQNTTQIMKMSYDQFHDFLTELYSYTNPMDPSITIGDASHWDKILTREFKPKNLTKFQLTEGELESLEITFDPELNQIYQESQDSLRNKPLIPWTTE